MNKLARLDDQTATVIRIRRQLEESRQRLASSADVLQADLRDGVSELTRGARELSDTLSWKSWAARHPWGFTLCAVGLGLFLGTRARS